MKRRSSLVALLGCLPVLALPAAEPPAEPDHRPAPVSVSSANYGATPREELLTLVYDPTKINPATRPLEPLARPQRYVFVPGELAEPDLPFAEICKRLEAVLARKGYHNAEDSQHRVVAPDQVDLVLRVNAGETLWRNPLVRTESLAWREGLVARPRGRTLATLGGDVVWENRAGGNDDALGAAAANESAPGFGGFGTGGGRATSSGPALSSATSGSTAQASAAGREYDQTREFYLLVVDAFDYAELKSKGASARRRWTTFVAAPRQPGQNYSDVLNTLLRVATPYFGENTRGIQLFDDARAEVKLGPLRVLETDVPPPAPRK